MEIDEEVESEIERQIKSYSENINRLEGVRLQALNQTNVLNDSPPEVSDVTELDACDNADDEYAELYQFFLFVAGSRLNKNETDSARVASDWTRCWKILGYSYEWLKQTTFDFLEKKADGLVPFDELPKKLWEILNTNRHRLPPRVSASFLVDRTIEHFKILRKTIFAKPKPPVVGEPPLIDLEPSEPQFKVEVIDNQEYNIPEVSSTTNSFCEHETAEVGDAEDSVGKSEGFLAVNKEMYDFIWQKMGSIAGSLQTTNLTTDSVMNVIVQSGLNAASVVALFGCDRYYKEASAIHQNPDHRRPNRIRDLLYAFLKPVSIGLPQAISLDSLVTYLIAYCEESKFVESFLTPDAFDAYNIALQGLPPQTQSRQDDPVSTSNEPSTSHHPVNLHSPPTHFSGPKMGGGSFDEESLPDAEEFYEVAKSRLVTKSDPLPSIIHYRDFKFTHGDDSLIYEKSAHPISQMEQMEEDPHLLKVFCHLESLGEGILGSDLLQIGVFAEDGRKLFVPILPPKTSRSMLEKLGYKTRSQSGRKLTSDSKITYQHKLEKSIPCEAAKEAMRAIISFLETSLEKNTDSKGIVLILLHSEQLMDLLRELWILKNKKLSQKFLVVKGVCFVEEIVRNFFIRNRHSEERLSMEDICKIVFKSDFGDITEADQKARMLAKVYSQMVRTEILRDQKIFRRISESRLSLFENFFVHMKEFRSLQEVICRTFSREPEPVQLMGLFGMFPNLLYRDEMLKYNEKELSVAAKYIELLVASGFHKEKLEKLSANRDPSSFFSTLKCNLLKNITSQQHSIVTQLETCIAKTIEWLKRSKSPARTIQSPGHASPTPMPSKHSKRTVLHRRSSTTSLPPQRLQPEFFPFRDALAKYLSRLGESASTASKLANDMTLALPNAGFSWESLKKEFSRVRDPLRARILTSRVQNALLQSDPKHPLNWKGHGVDYIINFAVAYIKGQPKNLVDLVELVSEDSSQDANSDEELATKKSVWSKSDQQIWNGLFESYPDLVKPLDSYCDFLRGSNDSLRDVSSQDIILNLLKLVHRKNLSLEDLQKTWVTASDRVRFVNDLLEEIAEKDVDKSRFFINLELMGRLFEMMGPKSRKRTRPTSGQEAPNPAKRLRRSVSTNDRNPDSETLNRFLDSNFDQYVRARICPESFTQLHEFLFYHERLRQTGIASRMTNDFITHLIHLRLDHRKILMEVETKLQTSSSGNVSQHSAFNYLKEKIISDEHSLPDTCKRFAGLLLDLMASYYVQAVSESFPVSTSRNESKNSNPLDELYLHLVGCFVEETKSLIAGQKRVTGLNLGDIDMEKVRDWASPLVASLTSKGFSIMDAIEWHFNGSLKLHLCELLTGDGSSTLQNEILIQICADWIDALVKRRRTLHLPTSPQIRKLLRAKILSMVKSECVVAPTVARRVLFTDEALQFGLSDSKQGNRKRFIDQPGNVVSQEAIIIRPGQSGVFNLVMCGAPPLKPSASIILLPSFALSEVSGVIQEMATLLPNFRLKVNISNKHISKSISMPEGILVAKAIVVDPSKDLLPSPPTHVSVRKLLRHYCTLTRGDMSDVDIEGNFVTLGRGFDASLDKSDPVSFEPGGTADRAYTIETVVSFLLNYSVDNYVGYLRKVATEGATDFVCEEAARSIYLYLLGRSKFLPRLTVSSPLQQESSKLNVSATDAFQNLPHCQTELKYLDNQFLDKLVKILVQNGVANEEESNVQIETLFSILHSLGINGQILRRQVSRVTRSRSTFEKQTWARVETYCETNPDILEREIDPEVDDCVEVVPSKDQLGSLKKLLHHLLKELFSIEDRTKPNRNDRSTESPDAESMKELEERLAEIQSQSKTVRDQLELGTSRWFETTLNGDPNEKLWRQESDRIAILKEFSRMKQFFDKILDDNEWTEGLPSSIEMIQAWARTKCSLDFLEAVFKETQSEDQTIAKYKRILKNCSSKFPPELDPKFLAQSTFDFFASEPVHSSKTIYSSDIRSELLQIQTKTIDKNKFSKLEQFYCDVLSKDDPNFKVKAALWIETWILLGFSFESVKLICTQAATASESLQFVVARLKRIFCKTTSLQPPDLKPESLIQVTLVYFRATILVHTHKAKHSGQETTPWKTWYEKKEPKELTESDVQKLKSLLEGWDPNTFVELYQQMVKTTHGVPEATVRMSLLHAIAPSTDAPDDQSALNNLFDYCSVAEEVEDGELLSNSDESDGETSVDTRKQCSKGAAAESLQGFAFDDVDIPDSVSERPKFFRLIRMKPSQSEYTSFPLNIKNAAKQSLTLMLYNSGMGCQSNWMEACQVIINDVFESIAKSQMSLESVTAALSSNIFCSQSNVIQRGTEMASLYSNLLNQLICNAEHFSPTLALHETARDLLFGLEEALKTVGPIDEKPVEPNDRSDANTRNKEHSRRMSNTSTMEEEPRDKSKTRLSNIRAESISSPEADLSEFLSDEDQFNEPKTNDQTPRSPKDIEYPDGFSPTVQHDANESLEKSEQNLLEVPRSPNQILEPESLQQNYVRSYERSIHLDEAVQSQDSISIESQNRDEPIVNSNLGPPRSPEPIQNSEQDSVAEDESPQSPDMDGQENKPSFSPDGSTLPPDRDISYQTNPTILSSPQKTQSPRPIDDDDGQVKESQENSSPLSPDIEDQMADDDDEGDSSIEKPPFSPLSDRDAGEAEDDASIIINANQISEIAIDKAPLVPKTEECSYSNEVSTPASQTESPLSPDFENNQKGESSESQQPKLDLFTSSPSHCSDVQNVEPTSFGSSTSDEPPSKRQKMLQQTPLSPDPYPQSPDPYPQSPDPSPQLPDPSLQSPEPSRLSRGPSPRSPDPYPQSPDPYPQSPDPSPQSPDPSRLSRGPSPRSPDPYPQSPDPYPQSPDPSPQSPDPSLLSRGPSPRSPDPYPQSPDPYPRSPETSPRSPVPSPLTPPGPSTHDHEQD